MSLQYDVNMSIDYNCKSFVNFSAAHSPVRLDIEYLCGTRLSVTQAYITN